MKNLIGHFCTITKHRHLVIRHCCKAGIFWQGLLHDLSKYSLTEFIPGVRYYAGGRRSPNEIEREIYGHSKAWMHHKGRNRHHFEYWCDYNPVEKRMMPVKMPNRFLVEMVCDRIAASKIYAKEKYTDAFPLQYFLRGKPSRSIHPETSEELEKILRMLAEQGEKETFRYLRNIKK